MREATWSFALILPANRTLGHTILLQVSKQHQCCYAISGTRFPSISWPKHFPSWQLGGEDETLRRTNPKRSLPATYLILEESSSPSLTSFKTPQSWIECRLSEQKTVCKHLESRVTYSILVQDEPRVWKVRALHQTTHFVRPFQNARRRWPNFESLLVHT